MEERLTDKQECFCKEVVLNGGDQSAAYREAYNASKMKPESIHVKASELMAVGKVSVRVKELRAKVAEAADQEFDTSVEGLLNEYRNWISSDITEFMTLDEAGVKELPIELRRLVTSFKRTEKQVKQKDGSYRTENTFELKFVSKEKAAEMLNKHRGFYEKENEQQRQTLQMDSNIVFIDGTESD